MKILCVSATSQYRVLNAFFDAFITTARDAGHEIVCAEAGSPAASDPGSPVDLAFSFGGLGADIGWRAPYATWLVDHPVFSPRIFELRREDRVFVVAEEHIGVVNDFLGVDVPVGFVPHGYARDDDALEPDFSHRSRDIDVLFAGSYEEVAPPQWTTTDARLDGVLTTTVELVEERWDHHARELNVAAVFREAASHHGVPEVAAGHRLVAPVLATLDLRVRQLRRAACVRALDAAGIAVRLVGTGWESLAGLQHAVVVGSVDYAALVALQHRTKVALNVGPAVFNRGWHERVPLAMGTGAFCVSETNDFLAADAAISAAIETFEMPRVNELPDVVRGALACADRNDRTHAGFEAVCARHTWRDRAKFILDAIS